LISYESWATIFTSTVARALNAEKKVFGFSDDGGGGGDSEFKLNEIFIVRDWERKEK